MTISDYARYLTPAILLCAGLAHAGGVRMYGAGEVPQASDVANILSGGETMMNRPKMRGIRLDPAPTAQPQMNVAPGLEKVAEAKQTVVGLPVRFAFNSFEILPENEPQLDAVAEGIKMADGVKVVVEGHTDASGSASYNDYLSRQRAEAVRKYLMIRHGISASRLVVEGRGSRQPLNAADPYAAENRRVQLRAAN